jgi:hypothetical protein
MMPKETMQPLTRPWLDLGKRRMPGNKKHRFQGILNCPCDTLRVQVSLVQVSLWYSTSSSVPVIRYESERFIVHTTLHDGFPLATFLSCMPPQCKCPIVTCHVFGHWLVELPPTRKWTTNTLCCPWNHLFLNRSIFFSQMSAVSGGLPYYYKSVRCA